MINKIVNIVRQSGTVIVGILITGFLLDEIGSKGRLGKTAQDVAKKVTRGFGQ